MLTTEVLQRDLKKYVAELADILDKAERIGHSEDKPEGARYIQMSDKLAIRIADHLRSLAGLPAAIRPVRVTDGIVSTSGVITSIWPPSGLGT